MTFSGLRILPGLHPAVYIAEIFVVAGFIVTGSVEFVLYVALPVVVARLCCGNIHLAWLSLWRLKFFFIALGLLAWLGSPGFPGDWYFAFRTFIVLALLVLVVDTFHQICDTGEKLAALFWWLRPLAYFGIPVERFIARLWLTLQFIPRQQQSLQQAVRSNDKIAELRRLLHGANTSTGEYQLDDIEVKPGAAISLPHLYMSWLHWCRPLLLAFLLWQLRLYIA